MTREEALIRLSSDIVLDRFKAALELSRSATGADLPALLNARSREKDAYVLSKISAALIVANAAAAHAVKGQIHTSSRQEHDPRILRSQAVEEVSGTLLHEIGSKLGLVALACSEEVPDYTNSKTAARIKNLQSIFEAIQQLRSAANPAGYDQFDLAELLDECTAIEGEGRTINVALHGRRPSLIHGSQNLIRLSFCNGIRNAFEAVGNLLIDPKASDAPIIVTWGENDRQHWISIIDSGPGLAGVSKELIFRAGGTTKTDHIGYGMAIARQAMDTLDGFLDLENSPHGGARFEMRWSKKNENSNS